MGAHPDAGIGDLTQDGIELPAIEALLDRVYPDEYAVKAEQLISHRIRSLIGVDDGLSRNA